MVLFPDAQPGKVGAAPDVAEGEAGGGGERHEVSMLAVRRHQMRRDRLDVGVHEDPELLDVGTPEPGNSEPREEQTSLQKGVAGPGRTSSIRAGGASES